MNNEEMNIKILNIKIENLLYPLVSSLKQTNKPTLDIIREIAKFKEINRELMGGLDKNYIEKYLNEIYSKRNNGAILIKINEQQQSKER